MENIFLIFDNPNDYDTTSSVEGFVLTEDEAKQAVKELTIELNKARNLFKDIMAEKTIFEMYNPPLILEQIIQIPKWASGLSGTEITEDMRKERNRITDENSLINKRNQEKNIENNKKIDSHLIGMFFCDGKYEDVKKYFNFNVYGYSTVMFNTYLDLDTPYYYESINKLTLNGI